MKVKLVINGSEVWASARQAVAIQTLLEARKGGFATIKGYVAKSGRVSPETADFTVLTRFDTDRLYARRINALTEIKLEDISETVESDEKLSAAAKAGILAEAFEQRKLYEIESMQKTLVGDRSDAHRKAHDRCYINIDSGVKVHLKTEKGEDGLKHPVIIDGFPIVESIMLSFIEISRTVITPGEYKSVNSGVPVLISKAINKKMPKSTKLKMVSLKEDNFDSIVIDNNVIIPKDIAGDFT